RRIVAFSSGVNCRRRRFLPLDSFIDSSVLPLHSVGAVGVTFQLRRDNLTSVYTPGTALAWQQWVNVSGQWILYRTHVLQTNVVNVGTYFPASGFGLNR
ncbi:MAG: hypothetical protein ABR543_01150, partial [Gemmatimonadaceae bacterium]